MLAAAGIVLSLVYTGSALATTAIGTLIPILSDSGELRTRLGTFLLAAGAVGEFGPIPRQMLKEREIAGFDSKLTAVGFGVLIPFFFVFSGMQLDIDALFASVSGVVKLVVFFILFAVVRGTPAGHMRASTAASLVGAALLSTLIYPLMGLRARRAPAAVAVPA